MSGDQPAAPEPRPSRFPVHPVVRYIAFAVVLLMVLLGVAIFVLGQPKAPCSNASGGLGLETIFSPVLHVGAADDGGSDCTPTVRSLSPTP